MNKKVCAIVELGDHYKISLQSEYLLSQKYYCKHYLINSGNEEWRNKIVKSLAKNNLNLQISRNLFSLLWNLKQDSEHLDLIYFQGFVDDHPNRKRFLVLMFLLLNKKKIVVAIRNGFSYMPDKIQKYWSSYYYSGKSKIRGSITKILQYFRIRGNVLIYPLLGSCVFETKTQLDFFRRNISNKSKLNFGVIYDRYKISDNCNLKTAYNKSSEHILIGLLGGLSESRRDYFLLIEALNLLENDIRKKLKFVALGNSMNSSAARIISELRDKVKLEIISPYLSEEEFELYGKSCSFLLSPLKEDKPYGTLCGTGSFGDLVYLGRKLIIPRRVDPYGEFQFGSLYYDDSFDLKNILKEIVLENKNGILDSKELNPFSKEEVLSSLENDNIF